MNQSYYLPRKITVGVLSALCLGVFLAGTSPAQALERIERAIVVIGGAGDDGPYRNDAWAYVPSEDRWYELEPMPRERRAMGYTYYGGKIYVYGGWEDGDGRTAVDRTEIYDPFRNQWTTGARMPKPRGKMGHMYPAVNGRIYVGGGERHAEGGGYERLAEFAVYHIHEDRWEELEPMPRTRSFPYVMRNPLRPHLLHFVAGNADEVDGRMTDWHSVYDTETGQWEVDERPLFPLPQTDGDGAEFFNGRWWILGGWSHRSSPGEIVYSYDFCGDAWVEEDRIAAGTWSHQGTALVHVDGEERLYMMGGRVNGDLTDEVWYHNGDGWHETGIRLPRPRWNFIAVTVDLNLDRVKPLTEPGP